MAEPQSVKISVGERQVSGLLQVPSQALACYVLAHGAGAAMAHPFMVGIADGLAERGIATLRYQFPYMEQGPTCRNLPKRRFALQSLKHRSWFRSLPSSQEANHLAVA